MSTPNTDVQASTDRPVRILVAEDSPLNQRVALKQLEKLGYTADAVADGNQVLDALVRARYDIILMDCHMPGMSGYEATWQIRHREEERPADPAGGRRIYIIAMTANNEADSRQKCLAAGMDDFIDKPVQLVELDVALRRATTDRAASQAMEEVIDPVVIAGLRQLGTPGNAEPLIELIDLFIREAPAQLDSLSEAVARNDAASLARTLSTATALKGSAGNLGAHRLAALADEIEQTAKTGPLSDVKPLIERARTELGRVCSELEKIKSSCRG